MKKYFRGSFIAATALMCVVGMGAKADAALIIDFDNIAFDGGTVTQSGGNWTGTGIIFDSIFLKDTAVPDPLAGVQCGASASPAASSAAETCKLNFSTATNTFTVMAPSGLYAIGPDMLPYTSDRGGLVVAAGSTILTGSFTAFGGVGGVVFGATGVDTKNAALLQFFGLAPTQNFRFANTEIFMAANGMVTEADLTNEAQVPEPASMALFGLGLMGFGVISRRRRAQ
jgi:hypothetical protein